ncbi:MAG: prephenate dehydrogenase [Helicobacter sp.]|uniref:prephenate dehydrogenase n=1 Tax=Helicobacter sp. 10-6591 TaxID=2004998 RepID=UPI000DCBD861|nr:prephenate dehydrogenase [Helicobacter sp. 10-6591]MCI7484802.1 prephenate dehydrogenase [Helicobacter sp.]MDD7566846.1 prephenate dehydrogenase [Helicobacter sp.]MDY5740181.1 prephenate dehydrogenase [Helicobacter sp.]RAX55833.1 prephenate dehydrogenase [Helicobacter sp. 10-6591]
MQQPKHIGIVGLGLIGGSIGLALKELKCFKSIVGYDISPLHSSLAVSLGLVDECVELEDIFNRTDVIFLAVPVEGIIEVLQQIKCLKPETTIIDLGGTKQKILDSVPLHLRKNFIAAHPMSGTEFYGPKAALRDLFKDKIVILSDLQDSGAYQVQVARDIFLGIGMKIIKMSAQEHDKHIALISHMPHVISYALANAVLKQEDPQMILALVGGGFLSMSRLSKSSPKMWRDIFKQNKDNVLDSLASFENELTLARKLIEQEDWDGLESFMAHANKLQDFL